MNARSCALLPVVPAGTGRGDGARALSLDVAVAAIPGGLLAAHVCGARLPWTWWPVLAASVWVAYTADHLLDARAPGARCRATRHRVHRDHGRILGVACLGIAALAAAVAVLTLPVRVSIAGSIVAAAVAVHVGCARRVRMPVPKEITAALIYAAGAWVPPMVVTRAPPVVWWLAGLHASAAFSNLGVNAWFERGQDREDGVPSLARTLGRRRLRRLLGGTAALGVAAALAGSIVSLDGPPAIPVAFLVLAVLQGVPWILLSRAARTRRRATYRVVGDAVFLLCLAVLPWAAS